MRYLRIAKLLLISIFFAIDLLENIYHVVGGLWIFFSFITN